MRMSGLDPVGLWAGDAVASSARTGPRLGGSNGVLGGESAVSVGSIGGSKVMDWGGSDRRQSVIEIYCGCGFGDRMKVRESGHAGSMRSTIRTRQSLTESNRA